MASSNPASSSPNLGKVNPCRLTQHCRHHSQAATNSTTVSTSVINGFTQILLCVYNLLGTISIAQIELVMERVLLKLADGKGVVSLEQQEAALEGVLDLCRQPGFVHDIFVNCDCR